MSGARGQVTRLLALTPYLRARPEGVPLRELADVFGVKPAQLVKDLKVLWMCGLPGYGPDDLVDINVEAFEDDPDGLVQVTNSDFLARPLRLGSSEAAALIVALSTMRESSDDQTRPVIDRLLEKLRVAAGQEAPAVGVVPSREGSASPLRADLEAAVRDDRQIRIVHLSPHRDERTTRVVDPVAVQMYDGSGYLDAWCHQAQGRRLFRLDRIEQHEVLDTPREQTGLEPLDLTTELFVPAEEAATATLWLDPEARWVAGYYPVDEVREVGEGALEVDLRVNDPRWLVNLVLGAAPSVRVLRPESMAEEVRSVAATALAGYHGSVE